MTLPHSAPAELRWGQSHFVFWFDIPNGARRAKWDGGEGGIRTLDTLSGIPDFESGAFDQLCHLSKVFAGISVSNSRFFYKKAISLLPDSSHLAFPG
jgi:hypothetical protein